MKSPTEAERKAIAERLRRACRAAGYTTLSAFSRASDIAYSTLQGYLSGKRGPSGDVLIAMLAAGIDVPWVLTGQTPRSVSKEAAADVLAGGNRDLAVALPGVCEALRDAWPKDDSRSSA